MPGPTSRIVMIVASLIAAGIPAVPTTNPVATFDEDLIHKSVGVRLPVKDFRAIELDEDRERLYFAQGVGAGRDAFVRHFGADEVTVEPGVASKLMLEFYRGLALRILSRWRAMPGRTAVPRRWASSMTCRGVWACTLIMRWRRRRSLTLI